MDRITERISQELNKPAQSVQNVINLLDEGNTIPSSPATARKPTGRWTTNPFAPLRSG